MKVFVDANILVSVLNMEYPVYPFSARILGLTDQKGWQIYTSPVCLAIAFYFAEKRYGASSAKKRMLLLSAHLSIAPTTMETVYSAFNDRAVLDFEDGLEYFSAVEVGCAIIVTEDKEDFHFSKLEVLTAEEFVTQHLLSKRF
jgi:predicted nucleic acid-binding protein